MPRAFFWLVTRPAAGLTHQRSLMSGYTEIGRKGRTVRLTVADLARRHRVVLRCQLLCVTACQNVERTYRIEAEHVVGILVCSLAL